MGLSDMPKKAFGNFFYSCLKKLNLGHCQELLKTPFWAQVVFLRLTEQELCEFVMQDGNQ